MKEFINRGEHAKEEAKRRIGARRIAREHWSEDRHSREPMPSASMFHEPETTGTLPEPEVERPVATIPPGDAVPIVDGRVMSDATPMLLSSVPLDKETQWAVYELCGDDNKLFCATMAIGYHESRFNADAVGDDSLSIGWLQINEKWHRERMERLGVSDLTDPVQCAAVAIDYITELAEGFGSVDDHPIYVAYNAGPTQARELLQGGTTSTDYSQKVLALYNSYLTEMEAQG